MTKLSDNNSQSRLVPSGERSTRAIWNILIWSILISPVFGTIVNTRDFVAGLGGNIDESGGFSLGERLFRAAGTYWLFALFLLIVVHGVRTRLIGGKKPKPLVCLWLSAMMLATLPIISTLAIKPSALGFGDLTMFLIFTVSFLLKPVNATWWIKRVRIGLLVVYVYGSLFAALIAPKWAFSMDYEAQLSLFSYRLYGLAAHANSLAPLAAMFIILGWYSGVRLRFENIHSTVAISVLLLTQSKTAMVCFLIVVAIHWAQSRFVLRQFRIKLIFATIITIPLAAILLLVNAHKISTYITNIILDPEVITLTGRLPVWFVTVNAWLERPFLGIGLTLWDNDMRIEFAKFFSKEWTPNTAHSQFFQSLGTSGLVGLAALIVYLYILCKLAIDVKLMTNKVSILIMIFVIFRSFTEVWIRLQADANFILAWIVFSFILLVYHQMSSSAEKSSLNQIEG